MARRGDMQRESEHLRRILRYLQLPRLVVLEIIGLKDLSQVPLEPRSFSNHGNLNE
jgi:hypothetical protein